MNLRFFQPKPPPLVHLPKIDSWLKIHLFFPLDAHQMFAVFHHERWINALLIGSLGLIAWLWCWLWGYRWIEPLILPHDDQ